jgi:branched-chain amino acid transport system permease protein
MPAVYDAVRRNTERFGSFKVIGLLVLGLIVAPIVLGKTILFMSILVFAIFALGYDLLLGQAGLISFGHAAFFGLGSYTTVIAAQRFGLSMGVALLLLVGIIVVASAVMGYISLQRRGLYFAMITLAAGQAVYTALTQPSYTGGTNGLRFSERLLPILPGIPIDFNQTMVSYYIILAVFVLVMLFVKRLKNSPFGLTLLAIKENEERANHLGYNTTMSLLCVFVISAIVVAIAGMLKALAFGLAPPSDLHWLTNGDVLLMTLLGGTGALLGPVVGAILYIGLEEVFVVVTGTPMLYFGIIILLVVLFIPTGIVGWVKSWAK